MGDRAYPKSLIRRRSKFSKQPHAKYVMEHDISLTAPSSTIR